MSSSFFYLVGGFLALFGLGVLSIGGKIEGSLLIAVSLPFLIVAVIRNVGEVKERELNRRVEAEFAAAKEAEEYRKRREAQAFADERRRTEIDPEQWWKDHHRSLWDPTYDPHQLPRLGRRGDGFVQFPESTTSSDVPNKEEWLDSRVKPAPQPYGVSSRGAEELTAEWLRFLGEDQVEITQFSQDGGADVLTATYCCQVKNYEKKPVSVMEVRALLGTSVSLKLNPLLFTASKPTNEALIFSNENDIAVIEFDATNASLSGLTAQGHALLSQGLYRD